MYLIWDTSARCELDELKETADWSSAARRYVSAWDWNALCRSVYRSPAELALDGVSAAEMGLHLLAELGRHAPSLDATAPR
jgi:hypothetical protein